MTPKTSTDVAEFLELETTVWQALVTGDRDVDSASLHDNFVGLYPTGYANKAEHVDQLADGPTVAEFLLEEARLIPVSDDAALL